ncbi:hypothetical protein ACPUEN_00945 [Algoriphagus yeomjeoni]|uniref:hypothetical protein n=1 Tax=Algoriphagus yeomjeoni TaxID=291403 RepID=UPI003CE4A6A2
MQQSMEGEMSLPKLPDIISPTPTVAELGKYGTYPVSMNTGIPNISFPLFIVEAAEISIPFSLSYHAGGIKVNQESTEVGLGWSISGPMVIHRNVLGTPDETTEGNFNMVPMDLSGFFAKQTGTGQTKSQNYYYLKAIADGAGRDTRPDIFNYNISGKSGQFIYAPDRTFFTFPYEPIKISLGNPTGNFFLNLVDEKGTTYVFSEYNKILINDEPNPRSNYITDLYVKEIISYSKQDTVRFEYETKVYSKNQTSLSHLIGGEFAVNSSGSGSEVVANRGSFMEETSTSTIHQQEKFVKRITYRNGQVVFNYNTTRIDRNVLDAKSLDEILVYDGEGVLVKKFVFNHDYFTATFDGTGLQNYYIKRLKLTSFSEVAVDQPSNLKTYSFDYNTSIPIPKIGSFAQDYWGMFNGRNNSTLIPTTSIIGGSITSVANLVKDQIYSPQSVPDNSYVWNVGSANRSSDTTKMQMAILKRITYPTKGFTTFEYEPHAYTSSSGSTVFGGGLRIKKIASYDKLNTLSGLEEYKYGVGQNGLATKFFDESLFFKNYDDYTIETFRVSGLASFGWISAWQRRYLGVDVYSAVNYNGLPWVYTEVNKYTGTNSSQLFKSKYVYNSITDDLGTGNSLFINSSNYGQMVPVSGISNLVEETHFRKNGSVYEVVNKVEYVYSQKYTNTINALMVKEVQRFVDMGLSVMYLPGEGGDEPQFIRPGQYQYKSKAYRLIQKKESNISYPSGVAMSLQTTTDYFYENPFHLLVTRSETTGSDGKVNKVKTFYPDDVTGSSFLSGGSLSGPEYTALEKLKKNNNHRISEPIQVENWVDATKTSTQRTTYKEWGGYLVLPEKIKASDLSNNLENRVAYHAYANTGKPVLMSMEGGTMISYLWAYKSGLPVAKAENALNTEIAYSSFETSEKGGWTYNGTPNSTYYRTGKKSYNLSTGSISKTGITASAADPFKVTFWTRTTSGSGSVTVAGQSFAVSTTWTLVEKTITSNSFSISGVNIIVDELRLHPSDALMTTYTYRPQLGIESATDPRNFSIKYEYDVMGRLKTIKDEDGYILEHYEYNYAN